MPGEQSGSNTNLYSSFDIADVHFVSINTELYYFQDSEHYNLNDLKRQYEWLTQDLKKANDPSKRKKTPWIIVSLTFPKIVHF